LWTNSSVENFKAPILNYCCCCKNIMTTQNNRPAAVHSGERVIVVVQFAGDFKVAYQSIVAGGGDNYYAQAHSVLGVADLAYGGKVVTICCVTDEAYEVQLANDVYAVGLKMQPGAVDEHKVWAAVCKWGPSHLVLRSPWWRLVNMAAKRGVPTMLTIADSFNQGGLRQRYKRWRMVSAWNRDHVVAVANHGRASAKQLIQIGVDRSKVFAWDWPHRLRPEQYEAKSLAANGRRPLQMIYAGSICESKGVGDLLAASRILKERGIDFHLNIVGGGDVESYLQFTKSGGLSGCVTFTGRVPHHDVVAMMRESDLVLVPSRHEYPEGFPMTLFEAMAVRTPVVASDHPMFAHALKHRVNAMIFKEKDSSAMADCIETLITDPSMYRILSESSLAAWQKLQVPVEWVQLLRAWFLSDEQTFKTLMQSGVADLAENF
jgi:glycosyltransferase involved in cell wall biosynthesis